MKMICIGILLAVLANFWGCENREKSDEFFMHGLEKYNKEDFVGALADFNSAIDIYSEDSEYFFFRAGAKTMLGKHKEALCDLNESVRLGYINEVDELGFKKGQYNIYLARAHIYYNMGEYKLALELINKALEMVDNNADFLLYYRGLCRIKLGDKTGGCEDLNKAKDCGLKVAKLAKKAYDEFCSSMKSE
jgi:tetratricopeptide (TPR) repeat protein